MTSVDVNQAFRDKNGFTRVKCELAVSLLSSRGLNLSKPPTSELRPFPALVVDGCYLLLKPSARSRSFQWLVRVKRLSSRVSKSPVGRTHMSHYSTESLFVLYAHNLKRRARTHTLAANLVVALGGSP